MLTKSQQKRPRKSLVTIDRRTARRHITVNGVTGKHGRFRFKDDKNATKVLLQQDIFQPSKGRQQSIGEHSKAKDRKTSQPFKCPADLIPLQEKLRQIKLKNFDRTTFDDNYVRMLEEAIPVLSVSGTRKSGIRAIEISINRMETWLEGKIDIGKIKRDANHNVRLRFTNWLRKAHEIKCEQDQQPPSGRRFNRERHPDIKSDPTELGKILNEIKEKAKDAKQKTKK